MLNTVLVMIGGAIGAALRYQLGRASLRIMGPGYPWGTLAANVLGGLAMGLVAGWLAARYQGQQGEQLRLLVAVGLLGGFTTFSAFSLETMLMIERGEALNALGYVLLSVAASIGALALGLTLMRSATA
ncbi:MULTISPECIES: fluoride efflux transporter CrcB [unclassified Sphingobium]|uniref:fluoride efflux transporter CrcB n=1 Tax=unclassified Sphingobium TaxID=2611147 RepID=UPI002225227C|nr:MULTISPECIES: fluoride efflux transporter CrcB [unclassified Sphingobium]MCW2364561.1 CrcB protein [Sphingobium sp. B7D2B]MCW2383167.1 CrcB protein [Sphingobium sp. B2D3B]MCW2399857.1 CrcB protein [Sphingobium sp. B2D3C]MCW2410581.1 CrcB protein [Sphingobium sp. B8D3D]MCW2413726.1 CrcB protein [Sphingobium sp. B8D3A]